MNKELKNKLTEKIDTLRDSQYTKKQILERLSPFCERNEIKFVIFKEAVEKSFDEETIGSRAPQTRCLSEKECKKDEKNCVISEEINNFIEEDITDTKYPWDKKNKELNEFTDLLEDDETTWDNDNSDDSGLLENLNESNSFRPTQVFDYLKTNFGSWKSGHNSKENAKKLTDILSVRYPTTGSSNLNKVVKNWIGYNGSNLSESKHNLFKKKLNENMRLAKEYIKQGAVKESTVTKFESLDPSPTKKYVGWMCKMYIQNPKINLKDLKAKIDIFNDSLERNQIPIEFRDIFKFKNYDSFIKFVNSLSQGEVKVENEPAYVSIAKKYIKMGKLTQEKAEQIIGFDKSKKKKYAPWLLKTVVETPGIDLQNLRNKIEEYHTFITANRIPVDKRDINKIATYQEFAELVDKINNKTGITLDELEDKYELIADTPGIYIAIPHSHEASRKVGNEHLAYRDNYKNCAWCTTYNNDSNFVSYYFDQNITFFYVRLKAPELIEALKKRFGTTKESSDENRPKWERYCYLAIVFKNDSSIDIYDGLDHDANDSDTKFLCDLVVNYCNANGIDIEPEEEGK